MRAAFLLPLPFCLDFMSLLLLYLVYSLPLAIAQQPAHPSPISQPVLSPNHTSILTTGTTYLITWSPSPYFSNITIEIWDNTSWGYSLDFGSFPCYHWGNPFCGTIVSHASNTGSYLWNIPKPVRAVGHRYPTGKRLFWIKLYVDDFWKDGVNTNPVVTYSERFAFAIAPGEDGGVGEGPTTTLEAMVGPTIAPNVLQQSTVLTTVHEPASTMIGTTTRSFNGSAMPTGVLKKNGTNAIQIEGSASKIERSLPALLLVCLVWLTFWG